MLGGIMILNDSSSSDSAPKARGGLRGSIREGTVENLLVTEN